MTKVGYTVTEDQESAIDAILNGKDVVACMPTGSGKSLIFQALALSCKLRGLQNFVIVIVTPLKSISFTHQRSFNKVRIKIFSSTAFCIEGAKIQRMVRNREREGLGSEVSGFKFVHFPF